MTQQEFDRIKQDVLRLLRLRGFERIILGYGGKCEQPRYDIVGCASPAPCKKFRQRMVNILAKLNAFAGTYVMAKLGAGSSDTWQGPRDSDGEPCRWINHYYCDECCVSWKDQWSCMCNDKCPRCHHEIEPYKSKECDLRGNLVDNGRPAAW